MDHDNPQLRDILSRATDVPLEQRAAFLDEACGDDAKLRARVVVLLATLDKADAFLGSPTVGHSDPMTESGVPSATVPPVFEGPGSRIGNYKLLQQIGEGGMGIVFMAEQEQPVRRRVALKIIKPGMDSRQVIARFEAERQALAVMDHPNIAHVYDAGATESGRPFFVMELVRGTPITEYCDKHELTTRERLELLVEVCQAVQHAHSKGIIHRDLKPSNVLVTIADGKPVPKVIDFGVAKATQGRLTEKTLFTEFRQLLGTPQYMSPEQAESNGVDIDTRSDVYCLGVLLYELLTGTTPLDGKELRSKAYAEMERMIRECEPPAPSTRLSTLGDAAKTIASRRKTEPRKLGQLLRGELDWIVLRALEKDRSRRYETANGLARDIQRYLADEPVEACPPSSGYRLRRFLRKHRASISVAAGFALVLIAATAISSWQAVRATVAQREEARQRKLANDATESERTAKQREAVQLSKAELATAREAAQRKQAEAVARLLESVFQGLDPAMAPDSEASLKPQLLAQLDEIAVQLQRQYTGEPLVRAQLRNALGVTQLRLGEVAKGQSLLKEAWEEQRTHAEPDDPKSLEIRHNVGLSYYYGGRYLDAIKVLEQVAEDRNKKLGANDAASLETLKALAEAYLAGGRYSNAAELFERVRDQCTRKLGAADPKTLAAEDGLASARMLGGHEPEAVKLLKEIRDQTLRRLGADDQNTLIAAHNLSLAYKFTGHHDDASKIEKEIRDRLIAKFGPEQPKLATLDELVGKYRVMGRYDQIFKLNDQFRTYEVRSTGSALVPPDFWKFKRDLVMAYLEVGRTEDAIKLYDRLRDAKIDRPGPDHVESMPRSIVNTALDCTPEDIIATLDQVRRQRERKLGPDHPLTLDAISDLAYMGRIDEAMRFYKLVRDRVIDGRGPEHPSILSASTNLAHAYQGAGRFAEAEKLFKEVRDRATVLFGPSHPSTLAAIHNLASFYLEYDRPRLTHLADAITLYEQLRDQLVGKFGADDPDAITAVQNLAEAYQIGHRDEAMKLWKEVWERQVKNLGPDDPDTVFSLTKLAHCYAWFRRYDEEVEICQRALEQLKTKVGPQHEATITAMRLLAQAYTGAGRAVDSIPLLQDLERHFTDKFGPDDQRTVYAQGDLAFAYQYTGRISEAIALREHVLDFDFRKRGAKDSITFWEMYRLAGAFERADNLDRAIQIYEKLVAEEPVQDLGRQNTVANLANLYRTTGQAAKAANLYANMRAEAQRSVQQKTEALAHNPSDPDLLLDRGRLYANLGMFQQAAKDHARAIDLAPQNARYWHGRGPLLLQIGDDEGYKRHRSQALQRFADTKDPNTAHLVAKYSLITLVEGAELKLAVKLADCSLAAQHDQNYPWICEAKGMAEYRSGHWELAIEWLKKGADGNNIWRDPGCELFMAMAYYKLGKQKEARDTLAHAKQLMEKNFPGAEEGLLPYFTDWIICQVVRRDAEELINGKGPTTKPIAPAQGSASQ